MLRRLVAARSGVAAIEFALALPLLLATGLMGLEVANRAIVQMQVSQIASHIADNASRVGDTSMLQDRRIYESDINDLLRGAQIQGGNRVDVFEHGRVIISSLEVVPDTEDQQYIHWQRCMGKRHHVSTYGAEGDGLSGGFPGMGPPGQEVWAFPGEAVMFVEVVYEYQSLLGEPFGISGVVWSTASYTVRDDRDLSQIYQRSEAAPDPVAACSVFGGTSAGSVD